MPFAFLAWFTMILNWRLHCSSRPQELFIDLLAIRWPPFDPVTIYRPLDGPVHPWGSISTTLRTTGLAWQEIAQASRARVTSFEKLKRSFRGVHLQYFSFLTLVCRLVNVWVFCVHGRHVFLCLEQLAYNWMSSIWSVYEDQMSETSNVAVEMELISALVLG